MILDRSSKRKNSDEMRYFGTWRKKFHGHEIVQKISLPNYVTLALTTNWLFLKQNIEIPEKMPFGKSSDNQKDAARVTELAVRRLKLKYLKDPKFKNSRIRNRSFEIENRLTFLRPGFLNL